MTMVINVRLVDCEKLEKEMTEYFKKDLEENEKLVLTYKLCLIENPLGGVSIMTNEAVGGVVKDNNVDTNDNDHKVRLTFYSEIKGKGTSIMPIKNVAIGLSFFVENYVSKEEIPFKEFQGTRHKYNPRIESNEHQLFRWYKSN